MAIQHFMPGIDPTAIPGAITKADLLQMWTGGYFVDEQGGIIWSQVAPDVVANPDVIDFLWGELDLSDVKTGNLFYYKNGAWTPFPLVDGSKLGDNTVPINKLKRTGANPLNIIQVNAANNGWQFVAPEDAIEPNTLAPSKLKAPDGINNYVLTCLAGVKAFTGVTSFVQNTIVNNTIPLNKLAFGGANTFMRMNSTANGVTWTTVDIADCLAAGYLAGQVPIRNAGNTGWIPYTPAVTTIVELTNGGAYYVLPTGGTKLDIPHGQASIPRMVNVRLRCIVANNGYAVGDELDVNGPIGVYSSLETTALFDVAVDGTNISIYCPTYSSNLPSPFFQPKGGGDSVAFDSTKWKAKVNLIV